MKFKFKILFAATVLYQQLMPDPFDMEWKCDVENLRSRAAAERLGYTLEGVFRQHLVVKGRNRDTAWFSIIDQEWPRISAAMRRWLYENDSVSLRTLIQTKLPLNGIPHPTAITDSTT